MGIMMMFIFISLQGRQFMEKVGLSSFLRERFETTSCRGVLAMLERTLPPHHRARCKGNNLALERVYAPGEGRSLSRGVLCPLLYRELANSLKLLADARTAPLDILERVAMVRLKLVHPQLTIHGITTGKDLAAMAKITSAKELRRHIGTTVQIQEFPATCL